MTQNLHDSNNTFCIAPILTGKPAIDMERMVQYRIERVREQLRNAGAVLAILTSPVSLRYVADFREFALFQSHIPLYYAFVPVTGPVVIYGGFVQSPEVFAEYRTARNISFFNGGDRLMAEAQLLSQDVVGFLADLGISERRIAVEYVNPSLSYALQRDGFEVIDAVDLMDLAKLVKSPEELSCMRWSIEVVEAGMAYMQAAMQPGVSENQLWSLLTGFNLANDGSWCEGRMLCSGPRTNPWLQESSERVIQAGDLVAFDTDMIGPFGYCADISRTWLCGDGHASDEQRELYQRAYEEVQANIELMKPGMTLREISERGFHQPPEFIDNRYVCLAHGVGMSNEFPKIYYRQDWAAQGYDGVLEENMVICVESYVGRVGGGHGVKLEQQVLVTANGAEALDRYPFEQDLLRREF